jgi:hypothetical protein
VPLNDFALKVKQRQASQLVKLVSSFQLYIYIDMLISIMTFYQPKTPKASTDLPYIQKPAFHHAGPSSHFGYKAEGTLKPLSSSLYVFSSFKVDLI